MAARPLLTPTAAFAAGLATAAAIAAAATHLPGILSVRPPGPRSGPSPLEGDYAAAAPADLAALPYPPAGLIPGARDVETPWGTMRVYEWGPADAERRVLLLHGISGSCVTLLALAETLASAGCRVMLPDLYGRGWSGGPAPAEDGADYDSRLYAAQVLVCLATATAGGWNGPGRRCTLLGYSLGGCLAVDFASYFPDLVDELILLAPGGLLTSDWRSRLLYSALVPGWLFTPILRRRLAPAGGWSEAGKARPAAPESGPADVVAAAVTAALGRTDEEKAAQPDGTKSTGDTSTSTASSAHTSTDLIAVSPARIRRLNLDAVVAWQLDHNAQFGHAFASTIRTAPTRDQQARWRLVGEAFSRRAASAAGAMPAPVLLVLGRNDPIIRAAEIIPEARRVLGAGNVEVAVYEGQGHGVATARGPEIAARMLARWGMGAAASSAAASA